MQPVFPEHIIDAHLNKFMFLIVVITIQGCVHESLDEFHHTFINILLGVITKTDKFYPLLFLKELTAETSGGIRILV